MRWFSALALAFLLGCAAAAPIKLHEPVSYNLPSTKLRAF